MDGDGGVHGARVRGDAADPALYDPPLLLVPGLPVETAQPATLLAEVPRERTEALHGGPLEPKLELLLAGRHRPLEREGTGRRAPAGDELLRLDPERPRQLAQRSEVGVRDPAALYPRDRRRAHPRLPGQPRLRPHSPLPNLNEVPADQTLPHANPLQLRHPHSSINLSIFCVIRKNYVPKLLTNCKTGYNGGARRGRLPGGAGKRRRSWLWH